MYVYKLLKQFYVLFKRKFYRFVQRLFLIIITCPNSIVRLTSLYFIPLDSGGLCHQVSIPSTANSGGCILSGLVGSHLSQYYKEER